jgi:3',5'-cyclic AMP phosphodiesterase CpdA
LGTNGFTTAAWFCLGTIDGGTETGSWEHVTAAGLVTNGPVAVTVTNLAAGTRYYYRLYAVNGFGDAWADAATSFVAPGKPEPDDITFFCISDIHYGLTADITAFAPSMVDHINELPGMPYPGGLEDGVVQPPRGVVVAGDTTERGSEEEWAMFTRDYGLHGTARLVYPVYEGYGNHDGSSYVVDQMKSRTAQRAGLQRISSNGMHYSWDWDNLHLVHLNVSPGMTYRPYDPRFSYVFLTNDLALSVGDSGRPVIIFHHFGYDSSSLTWWPAEDRTNFFNAITLYNVIAVVHGHSHQSGFYTRDDISICNTPHIDMNHETPPAHGFLVFHVSSNTLRVAVRTSGDTWGTTFSKSIAVPEPSGFLHHMLPGLLLGMLILQRK